MKELKENRSMKSGKSCHLFLICFKMADFKFYVPMGKLVILKRERGKRSAKQYLWLDERK